MRQQAGPFLRQTCLQIHEFGRWTTYQVVCYYYWRSNPLQEAL